MLLPRKKTADEEKLERKKKAEEAIRIPQPDSQAERKAGADEPVPQGAPASKPEGKALLPLVDAPKEPEKNAEQQEEQLDDLLKKIDEAVGK